MVEAALLLPLVLLLTLGLIEYGWIFLRGQQINRPARQGARIGANAGATNADVGQAIESWMRLLGASETVTVTVNVL